MFTVKAKMWYSGSAQTKPSWWCAGRCDRPGWYQASHCSTLATIFRCSSTAPLATPVVPPVYCSAAMSFMPSCTGWYCLAGYLPSASLKRTEPGRL